MRYRIHAKRIGYKFPYRYATKLERAQAIAAAEFTAWDKFTPDHVVIESTAATSPRPSWEFVEKMLPSASAPSAPVAS